MSNRYHMSSIFFTISDYIKLEYTFNSKQFNTNEVGFRRILNQYTGIDAVVNIDSAKYKTKNVADNHAVLTQNQEYAVLDADGPVFYPNFDPNISINNITIFPNLNHNYDRVRIHILSGYQFQNLFGFIASIIVKTIDNKLLKLASLSYTRSDFDLLYFNDSPLKISEQVFDKFVEFYVPSHRQMLDDQISFPNSTSILSYYLTNGKKLANLDTIYCEYLDITGVNNRNGITFFRTGEGIKFSFLNTDPVSGLVADIRFANDGDYIEYNASYNNEVVENFIFKLNSVAGNRYYIIHELQIREQVGNSFFNSASFSQIQTSNFDRVFEFKPIVTNSNTDFLHIQYTIRLYNSADGRSIFKTSNISTADVHRFGKNVSMVLNVGNTTQPIKTYNFLEQKQFLVSSNLSEIIKSKVVTVFEKSNNLVLNGINEDVVIAPFDNYLKFDIVRNDGESLKAVNISSGKVFMVFIRPDQSKLYIEESYEQVLDKTNGEILFKIEKQTSELIQTFTNPKSFIISKNENLETVIIESTWRKS